MAAVTLKFFVARYNVDVILTLSGIVTSTELSILGMLIQGMNFTEIAWRRGRSVKTISTQKARLYRKLGIQDELTLWLDLLFRYRTKLLKNEKKHKSS